MTSRQKPASFADSNPLLNDLQKRMSYVAHGEGSIKRIWLFGSRARGDYNEQSDVELCIEIDRDGRRTFGIFDQRRLGPVLRHPSRAPSTTPGSGQASVPSNPLLIPHSPTGHIELCHIVQPKHA